MFGLQKLCKKEAPSKHIPLSSFREKPVPGFDFLHLNLSIPFCNQKNKVI